MGSLKLGQTILSLLAADIKMWYNQELIYDIRRMTFEQFKGTYFKDEETTKSLFEKLQLVCDLNIDRNKCMDQLDELLVSKIKELTNG